MPACRKPHILCALGFILLGEVVPHPLAHAQRASIRAPMTATVRGQPHHLAYITPGEAELLRAHGGGIAFGGGQMTHKGIPAYAPNPIAPPAAPQPNPGFYGYLTSQNLFAPETQDLLAAFDRVREEGDSGDTVGGLLGTAIAPDANTTPAPTIGSGAPVPASTAPPASLGGAAGPEYVLGSRLGGPNYQNSVAVMGGPAPTVTGGQAGQARPGSLPNSLTSTVSALRNLPGVYEYLSSGSVFGPQTTTWLNGLGSSTGLFGNGAQVLTGANGMLTGGGAASSGTTATSGALGSTSLSSALSGGGIGGTIGSLMSMAGYGKPGPGTSIGGTVGGVIGSFVPIPGATFIGSTIGSLIGGLFGPNPSVGPNGGGWADINATGSIVKQDYGADNGGSIEGAKAMNAVISRALQDATQATGVKIDPNVRYKTATWAEGLYGAVSVDGKWVKGFEDNPRWGGVSLGKDPTQAASRLVEAVLRNATDGDAEAQRRLEEYLRTNGARTSVALAAEDLSSQQIAPAGRNGQGGQGGQATQTQAGQATRTQAGGAALPQGVSGASAPGVRTVSRPRVNLAEAQSSLPNPNRYDPLAASRTIMALANAR